MNYKSSYVKDIEKYFLSLLGRGIMLSSRDYDLIVKWKDRGIPKEIVYKGIRKAFNEGLKEKMSSSKRFLPGLTQCVPFVEEAIGVYQSTLGSDSKAESSTNEVIQKVLERLARIISSEKRKAVRKHYIKTRKRVLDLIGSNRGDMFKVIRELEESFYEDFFKSLSKSEREKILLEAESKISKRTHLMTEQARCESILSFRNEILKKEYGLQDIADD